MGSESDLEDLHNSILSLCDEDPKSQTLDLTLNLSPIKASNASLVDTPSTKDAVEEKCTPSILGSHVSKADEIFTIRAHSTPIVPKRLCPGPAILDNEHFTSTVTWEEKGGEEDEEDAELEELRKMKYEDLLSEVTVLCGLPRNSLLNSEGPSKLKMEDSLKNLNQTQLSKINMDSILSQSYIPKDKQIKSDVEDSKMEEKTPGRFVDLSTTKPVSSLLLEDDEEVELVDDILGLDEFIFSQLDSDDNFDEETLLTGEDTVVSDKTVKNISKDEVEASNKKELDSDRTIKSVHPVQNEYIVIDSTLDTENNNNTELNESKTSSKKTPSAYADINANVVCSGQKRKDSDLDKDQHDSKKSKCSDGKKVVTAGGISKRGFEKDETGSDVEYVVISLIDSSESEFDAKSDKEDNDNTLRVDKSKKSQISSARKGNIPTVCVSPLVENKNLQDERYSGSKQAKEGYCTQTDYSEERSFLKEENELTRSVMRKWKSNGIHNPDRNLTHATTFRRKNNGMKGRLEGFHLSTLHGENGDENFRGNSEFNSRSLTDCIRKLKMDMIEIERKHFACLRDMKCIFRSKMVEKDSVDRNRIRNLRCQQEMEVRSIHCQYVDPTVKRCKLMQLKMDHMAQIDHLQCIAMREDDFIRDEYSRKVAAERHRFKEQYNKMSSLVQQLSRREFEDNDDQFGPHIMVSLVKAPCIANKEKQTQVSVCLPLEIANAILKEDELYDRFYEY